MSHIWPDRKNFGKANEAYHKLIGASYGPFVKICKGFVCVFFTESYLRTWLLLASLLNVREKP